MSSSSFRSSWICSSVELPLHKACQRGSIELIHRIWNSSGVFSSGTTINRYWMLRKYIRTDCHYRQYQFALSMTEAVRLKNLEVVEWLADRFQGYTGRVEAAGVAYVEILQFLHDNDNASVDPAFEILTRCFEFSGLTKPFW
ncbi:hypothetical protein PC110_g13770 [Phytophthora cactorum]|uniref:Ankyrin repeat-containing domain n=1 Tax=Phytophthora cactorum TaxID=29920 RepID=A0A329RZF6_9STRA|nr:hypothetical protein PC114_g18158 [Phytophthora cactorum]KAG3182048.1 hypothetical protein C6341_g6129 [Phytophthora cactorum]RAW29875.1 hypothetical protein PC110_g13770 [Phytophthora cactorum]